MAQQMAQQPSPRGLILRNGLIFGALIALVAVIGVGINWQLGAYSYHTDPLTGVPTSGASAGASLISSCGSFIVDLALTFVAGMLTARKSGSVGAASLTGLVAGLLGALVGGIIGIVAVLAVVAPSIHIPAGSGISQSTMSGIIVGAAIGGVVLGLLVDGGIGAGVAALGGLVGRGSYEQANPPQQYQQSFYPGSQYGGQPYAPPPPPAQPYPGAPQYPPQPFAGTPQYPPQQYPGQEPPPPPPPYQGQ